MELKDYLARYLQYKKENKLILNGIESPVWIQHLRFLKNLC